MNKLAKKVVVIMRDMDTNCLCIEDCDYSVNGTLLTHCYLADDGSFAFTSGDMENDDYAEEIYLTYGQIKEVFECIIECYD